MLFVPRLTAGTDGPAPVRKLDLKKHEKSKKSTKIKYKTCRIEENRKKSKIKKNDPFLAMPTPYDTFSSDLSPIIVSNSLTHQLLFSKQLIDVTLVGEDANPNLVDVGTVADEECVGNTLFQIWKLKFVHTA